MSAGLVEFLRARLDEDEQVARAADDGMWHVCLPDYAPHSEHIARHDPERVLAEVEAKRRIIEEHPLQPASGPDLGGFYGCETCYDHAQYGIPPYGECPTLKLLALPYVDHRDYDEAWRP